MKKIFAFLALAILSISPSMAAEKTMVSAISASGDTITNTVTKTRFSTTFNMPPTASGVLATGPSEVRRGQSFAVDLYGVMSTSASPGTLTLTIDHGNGAAGTTLTALGTTGAITPPASLTNAFWTVHGVVVYNTTGQDVGVATFSGYLEIVKSDNTVLIYPLIANTSGTVGMTTGLDTTRNVYNILGAAVQWGTASAANTITQSAGSVIKRIS